MNTLKYIIFFVSLFIVFWANLGYFLSLKILSYFYSYKPNIEKSFPSVSLIVTAFNEEKRIGKKIDNCIALNYPRDKIEIIIASDCSTDSTNEIIRSYTDKDVKLITFSERHGKHYCQGEAIRQASGEIIVMTDATTFLKEDAVEIIVSNFGDNRIGIVSGKDEIANEDSEKQGEGFYVKYEMILRKLESKVGSLVGASGSFYAARKSLCKMEYPDMSGDFYLPIIAYTKGYITILDENAIGYYNVLDDPMKEFRRKVRTVVHGIDVLMHFKYILNPFKYGIYAFEMISHKLLRWLVPFALIFAFLSNILLSINSQTYRILLYFHIAFYCLALLAFFIRGLQRNLIFKITYYFVMANYSIIIAWVKYIKGERYIAWSSTKR